MDIKKLVGWGFLLILILIPLLTSCENKRDDNGCLGGMWQLLSWRDTQGDTIASKENRIFYCVQNNLIKFDDMTQIGSGFYGYFRHTPDSLIIYRIVENGNPVHPADTLVSIEKLEKFGVPEDGRFHIDILSEKKLILRSQKGVLTFRKY